MLEIWKEEIILHFITFTFLPFYNDVRETLVENYVCETQVNQAGPSSCILGVRKRRQRMQIKEVIFGFEV